MYKKISVITSSSISRLLINHLHQKGLLNEVVVPEESELIVPMIKEITGVEPVVSADVHRPGLSEESDLVIVMGYQHKLVLNSSVKAINIHFGPLPENRGPDPLFWTLKTGKRIAYVAIHEVNAEWDAGDILLEKGVDILPNESYGMLSSRLSMASLPLVDEIIEGKTETRPQSTEGEKYYSRPEPQDAKIDWMTMSASEIENLVNACNPKYGGAQTTIMGSAINLIEVEPADVNMAEDEPNPAPGTIVHSSQQHGLYVACKEERFLRLGVLSGSEGIFSGQKLSSLGMKVGTILGT